MANEKTVPKELAEQEFARFLEAMDLTEKCDTSAMDLEDVKGFEKHKRVIMSALERMQLVIDEDGQPTLTTSSGAKITFYEPTGGDLMAMDQAKAGRDVEKTNKVLAAMTKQPAALFAGMKNRDYRICSSLFTLFLA